MLEIDDFSKRWRTETKDPEAAQDGHEPSLSNSELEMHRVEAAELETEVEQHATPQVLPDNEEGQSVTEAERPDPEGNGCDKSESSSL